MAQFNSLLVTGESRFINPINGNARNGVYTVIGTQTASTSAWTGKVDVPALYDGLKIAYYLPYASTSSNVTLNLTLSTGATTGAINCYYGSTGRLTEQYSVGDTIILSYYSAGAISVSGTATTDNRWICGAYYDTNTQYTLGTSDNNITLTPSSGSTQSIIAPYSNSSGGIHYCETDASSTATAFIVNGTGITSLINGTMLCIKNTKVASASGCTINVDGLGAKGIWLSQSNSACTTHWALNQAYLFVYDGTNERWVLQQGRDTDGNDTYTVRPYYTRVTAGGNGIKGNSLFARMPNNKYSSFTTDSGTGTKTFDTTNYFDPEMIVYYNSSSNVAADALIANNTFSMSMARVNMRYSANGVTTSTATSVLAATTPVYLIFDPTQESDGCYKLKSPYYTQTPDDTSAIYVLLGYMEDSYRLDFWVVNPIFVYDGTALVPFVNASLSGLSDTTIATPSGGQTIIYDGDNDIWVNGEYTITSLDGNVLEPGTVPSGAISSEYTNTINTTINNTANTVTNNYIAADAQLSNSLQNTFNTALTQNVTTINGNIDNLQQQINSLSALISANSNSGVNRVSNSGGLNGITGWITTGSEVIALQDSTAQDNTVAQSMFRLKGTSSTPATLSQVVKLIRGKTYTFSFKACQGTTSRCFVQIVGSERTITVLDATSTSGWQTYSTTFTASGDSINILTSCSGQYFYIADILLFELGWMPAPDEIYTENVKLDSTGLNIISEGASAQAIINNNEISIYNNNNKVVSVNEDLTSMSRSYIDTELTIGKGRFIAVANGLDFILLD